MKIGIYICMALMLTSCGMSDISDKEYYSGPFVYFADAASMVDCATGERIAISNDGEYLEVERAYTQLNTPTQEVYIEFFGRRIMAEPMEGDKLIPTLVIDSLICFDRTMMCRTEQMLVGIYDADMPEGRYELHMKADYTYTQIYFPKGRGEVSTSGRWYRNAAAELVLSQQSPKAEKIRFEIIPAQYTIVKNSGGKPLIFIRRLL